MGALNWTQLHKSVWNGPSSKATGHAPRLACDLLVPLSYHWPACRRAGELAGNCARQRSWPVRTFSNWAILHIKGQNFLDVFYPFTSTYDPYKPWEVSWNRSGRFWEIRKTDRQTHTHTDRQTWQLYIYMKTLETHLTPSAVLMAWM